MNGLYVISGCGLILIGVALIAAAIIVFAMKRPKAEKETGTLEWLSGPLAGQSRPIAPEGFYIGRDETQAAVVLSDARISKLHLWIGIRGGRVMAVDPGSTNGTFRNTFEERITQTTLEPGDVLIFPEDLARARFG